MEWHGVSTRTTTSTFISNHSLRSLQFILFIHTAEPMLLVMTISTHEKCTFWLDYWLLYFSHISWSSLNHWPDHLYWDMWSYPCLSIFGERKTSTALSFRNVKRYLLSIEWWKCNQYSIFSLLTDLKVASAKCLQFISGFKVLTVHGNVDIPEKKSTLFHYECLWIQKIHIQFRTFEKKFRHSPACAHLCISMNRWRFCFENRCYLAFQ